MSNHSNDEIYRKLAMFKKEVEEILRENGLSSVGHTATEAATAQRAMIATLIDKLKEQDRHIAWMTGETIEAKQHFGEAVIIGVSEHIS